MTDLTVNLTEGTIAKLDLQPNDVIVLRITDPNWNPAPALIEEMRKRVRAALGDHEVIILAHGLDLEIASPAEIEELPPGPERMVVRR